MKQPRFTKAILAIGGAIVLLLFVSFLLRWQSERQEHEACRRLHQEITDKLTSLRDVRYFGKTAESDGAWNDVCETVRIIYLMHWGHYPTRVSEDSYRRLNHELDNLLQMDSERSVIFERVWQVIGDSSPYLHRHLQQKQDIFAECLARLKDDGAINREERR